MLRSQAQASLPPRVNLDQVDPKEVIRQSTKQLCQRSFKEFCLRAWPVIEPHVKVIWGNHLDAICLHLEAVSTGKIKRLLINIPPGHAKSFLVSVLFPAWMWTKDPAWGVIVGTYAEKLSIRDAVRCRILIRSDWYQQIFKPAWKIREDMDTKLHYANTEGGSRFSTSIGGVATGMRGNCIIVDDPLNAEEAVSDAALDGCIHWWDKAMPTRLNDPQNASKIIIMQRLHERDLSGHVLRRSEKTSVKWDHLCLPAKFDPEMTVETSIGWKDWRTEEGQLLFKEMFPEVILEEMKLILGPRDFDAQFQQRASAAEGNIFKRAWVKRYGVRPAKFDELAITCDFTFKDDEASVNKKSQKGLSYVVLQVWGRLGPNFYLVDEWRGRWNFPTCLEQVKGICARWPEAWMKLVEGKANGPAIVQMLKDEIGGFEEVNPRDSKVARANVASKAWRTGNVWVPTPELWPDVEEWLHEIFAFPTAAYDDRVDAMSQLLVHWMDGGVEHFWNR